MCKTEQKHKGFFILDDPCKVMQPCGSVFLGCCCCFAHGDNIANRNRT